MTNRRWKSCESARLAPSVARTRKMMIAWIGSAVNVAWVRVNDSSTTIEIIGISSRPTGLASRRLGLPSPVQRIGIVTSLPIRFHAPWAVAAMMARAAIDRPSPRTRSAVLMAGLHRHLRAQLDDAARRDLEEVGR